MGPPPEEIRQHLLAMGAAVRTVVSEAGGRAGFAPVVSGATLADVTVAAMVVVVDPRPLLGVDALGPHPYDLAAALIAAEAGCVVVDLDGAPLRAPLDTTSPVGWVGVANARLAEQVLPAVVAARAEVFG